jgi:FkbM family methyltransferase
MIPWNKIFDLDAVAAPIRRRQIRSFGEMNQASVGLNRLESLRRLFGGFIDVLRIRQCVTWFLGWFPVRLRADDERVRIRCWSDMLAFAEIFRIGVYDPVFDDRPASTYCDLGCQSGFALLRLAQRAGAPQKALLVDGNPKAVARCRENIRAAGLTEAHVVHGALGFDRVRGGGRVPFTVRPNELECSLATTAGGGNASSTIDVPAVDLEKLWVEHVGDVACDLLKVDIEGAELGVLEHDIEFLTRVSRCVIEWHDPPASREQVIELLKDRGFGNVIPLCGNDTSGVLYCEKVGGAAKRG